METNRSLIESRRHSIRISVPKQPIAFNGDFARTVQIIANLVHNAAKYTAAGGELSIAASPEAALAVIRVRDSGIGIPKSHLADIFDPFVQLPQGAQDLHGGLGVGLTLVKTLTELHGGTVEALSAGAGRGSEFVVRLPGLEPTGVGDAASSPARASAANRESAAASQDPAA